jgi:hypothetical protein
MKEPNMKKNEASWDRIARVILGLTGIGIAVAGISPWGWLGLIPLVTGAAGFCPIYFACKVKTAKD